jgi:hypothetical protein
MKATSKNSFLSIARLTLDHAAFVSYRNSVIYKGCLKNEKSDLLGESVVNRVDIFAVRPGFNGGRFTNILPSHGNWEKNLSRKFVRPLNVMIG